MAIKDDGTLWGWGANFYGQLGNGTSSAQVLAPTQIGSSTWNSVSCGQFYTLAIKSDDTLWAWGTNGAGQLGNGTKSQQLSPVQIGTSTWDTIQASFSDSSIGIKTDGTLWGWGSHAYNSIAADSVIPIQMSPFTYDKIALGNSHGLVLLKNY
jgi:alpha-tubulin suppressor-like RCC1 family protein